MRVAGDYRGLPFTHVRLPEKLKAAWDLLVLLEKEGIVRLEYLSWVKYKGFPSPFSGSISMESGYIVGPRPPERVDLQALSQFLPNYTSEKISKSKLFSRDAEVVIQFLGSVLDVKSVILVTVRGTGRSRRLWGDIEIDAYSEAERLDSFASIIAKILRDTSDSTISAKLEKVARDYLHNSEGPGSEQRFFRPKRILIQDLDADIVKGFDGTYMIASRDPIPVLSFFVRHVKERVKNKNMQRLVRDDRLYKAERVIMQHFSTYVKENTVYNKLDKDLLQRALIAYSSKEEFYATAGSVIIVTKNGDSFARLYRPLVGMTATLVNYFPDAKAFEDALKRGQDELRESISKGL